MVTAILPSLTGESGAAYDESTTSPFKPTQNARHSIAMSLESDITITPERYRGIEPTEEETALSQERNSISTLEKPSALAGFVGLFTGCGALVALSVFLPLPARFGDIEGVTPAEAITDSFYVVGIVAFLVAIFVFVGLRDLQGEDGKGWRVLLGLRNRDGEPTEQESHEKQVSRVNGSCRRGSFAKMPVEGLALSPPPARFRFTRLQRLPDRPRLPRRLCSQSLDCSHLSLHPPLREHLLHQQRFLPRVAA